MWVDSHCHLQYEGISADAVEEAREAGVSRMVCVGTDAEQSRRAVSAARAWPGWVWATAGVHPHEAVHGVEGISALLEEPDVVAVGECGLDYHYDHSPRPVQREVFATQVGLARASGLALVVHTREAWEDTFAILRAEAAPQHTVFHCFTGSPDEARRALDMGGYLSFSGIVTFKGAEDVRAAARLCPPDRLLVETDAPYLAPVPHRGQPNRPAWVAVVGEAVAALRDMAPQDLAAVTRANAFEVFGLS